MKLKYRSQRLDYDLFEEPNGSLVISVLCGTIGLYDARIRLNEEETVRYQAEGEQFLDELATMVRKEQSKFRIRLI